MHWIVYNLSGILLAIEMAISHRVARIMDKINARM